MPTVRLRRPSRRAALAGLLAAGLPAQAQDARHLELLIPGPKGGGWHVSAHAIGDALKRARLASRPSCWAHRATASIIWLRSAC